MNKLLKDSTLNESGAQSNDSFELGFTSCLSSFEAEATTLERGFRTALFVQRFKAGLLLKSVRGAESLQ